MMTPLISVVVTTNQNPDLLEQCLQALFSQTIAGDAYEIVIVDNDPKDESTRLLVEEWQQRLDSPIAFYFPETQPFIPITTLSPSSGWENENVREVQYTQLAALSLPPSLLYIANNKPHNHAAARNLGWRSSSGQIIAFTEDHCIPEPDWLLNGVSAFIDGVTAVSGRIIIPILYPQKTFDQNSAQPNDCDFNTANSFYRKSLLAKLGGFDERFSEQWRADTDFFYTIQEKTLAFAWARGAIVTQLPISTSWKKTLKDQKEHFYNALLYRKHPELGQKVLKNHTSLQPYLALILFTASLIGLFTGQALLGIAGLILWSGFCLVSLYSSSRPLPSSWRNTAEILLTAIGLPFFCVFWRIAGALRWRVPFH